MSMNVEVSYSFASIIAGILQSILPWCIYAFKIRKCYEIGGQGLGERERERMREGEREEERERMRDRERQKERKKERDLM